MDKEQQTTTNDHEMDELEDYISCLHDISTAKISDLSDFVMTLKKAADTLPHRKQDNAHDHKYRPVDVDVGWMNWRNPTEDEFLKHLGRKKEVNLRHLFLLIDYFDSCRYEQHVFSRNHLASIFKMKPTSVERMLKTAELVDLIRNVSQESPSYTKHIARVFLVNPNIVSLLCKIREDRNRKNLEGDSGKDELYQYRYMVTGFENKVRITQRTRIPKVFSDSQCNELVVASMPFLKYYQEKAAAFSQDLADELKVSCEPNINRTLNYITKIGLRFTTPYSNDKKKYMKVDGQWVLKPTNPNYIGEYKEDFLERYFGKSWRGLGRYDVKNSIYRLTHFLNFGIWLPASIDLYERILGHPFTSHEQRDAIKDIAMTVYFLKSTKDMRAKRDYCLHLMSVTPEQATNYFQQLRTNMENAVGPVYGSDIFVYESCLYLDIVYDLRFKYGYDKVAWIYDEWIADKPSSVIRRDTMEIIGNRQEEWKRIFKGGENPYAIRNELGSNYRPQLL